MILGAFTHNIIDGVGHTLIARISLSSGHQSLIILSALTQAVLVGIESESGRVYQCLPTLDLLAHAVCILSTAMKLASFRTLFVISVWNIVEILVSLACLFDVIEVSVFGRYSRLLAVRYFAFFPSLRIYVHLLYSGAVRIIGAQISQALQVMKNMTLVIVYTAAFNSLLALMGAFLVTADILPAVTDLHTPVAGNWMESRVLFGSVVQSYVSMVEIAILDDWYSYFCHPLIKAGRWFSAFIVLFIVSAASLAYGNLLLACMTDGAITISREVAERERHEIQSSKDGIRQQLLLRLSQLWVISKESWVDGSDTAHVRKLTQADPVITECTGRLEISKDDLEWILRISDENCVDVVSRDIISVALPRIHSEAQGQDIVRINTALARAETGTIQVLENSTRLHGIIKLTQTNLEALHLITTGTRASADLRVTHIERDYSRALYRHALRQRIASAHVPE